MIGQRLFPHKFGGMILPPGGFGRDLRGRWWARPPGENARVLDPATVIEHADGTLSVRGPVNGGHRCFSLERGVWDELTEKESKP